ncbi:hypothetical protein GCM10011404_30590 [Sphingomonas prati]|nr:hypothetical protein GCM10011404_30590 [Sphingomonas prati]
MPSDPEAHILTCAHVARSRGLLPEDLAGEAGWLPLRCGPDMALRRGLNRPLVANGFEQPRWLKQSIHYGVAYSTASTRREGPAAEGAWSREMSFFPRLQQV